MILRVYTINVPENKRFNFKNIDPESLSEIGLCINS